MFNIVLTIVGMIFMIAMLIWLFVIFISDIIRMTIDYINENKKFVMICLIITVAIAAFLNFQNQLVDIVAISIMLLLSIPLIAFFIGVALELIKSPYSIAFGDFFFKYGGLVKIGVVYYLIGCAIYLIIKNVIYI